MNHPGRYSVIVERKKQSKLNTYSERTNKNRLISEVVDGLANESCHAKNHSTSDSTA